MEVGYWMHYVMETSQVILEGMKCSCIGYKICFKSLQQSSHNIISTLFRYCINYSPPLSL